MAESDMTGLPEMPSASDPRVCLLRGVPLICPEWLGLCIEPQGHIDTDIPYHCPVLLSETVSLACWRPLANSHVQTDCL
jgi:hypothetical protein